MLLHSHRFPNLHLHVLALKADMNYLLSITILVLLHLQGSRTRVGKQDTGHTLFLRTHKQEQNHTHTPIPEKLLPKLPPPLNHHTLFKTPVWAWVSPLKTQEGC